MTEPMSLQRVRVAGASPFPLSTWLRQSFALLSRRQHRAIARSGNKNMSSRPKLGAPYDTQPPLDATVLRFLHAQFQHLFEQHELDHNYPWALQEHLRLVEANRAIEMLKTQLQHLQRQLSSGTAAPAVSEAIEPAGFDAAALAPQQPPSHHHDFESDDDEESSARPCSSPPPPISISLVMQFVPLRDIHSMMAVCRSWSTIALEPLVWSGRSCSVLLISLANTTRFVFQPNLEADEVKAPSRLLMAQRARRAERVPRPCGETFRTARLYRHCPTLQLDKSCRKRITGPFLDQVLALLPSLTSLSLYLNNSATTRLLLSHPLILRARILCVDLGRSVTERITLNGRYSSDDDSRPLRKPKASSAAPRPALAAPRPALAAPAVDASDEDDELSEDDSDEEDEKLVRLTPMEAAESSPPFTEIVRGIARCVQLRQLTLRLMHEACEQQLHAVDLATLLEATPQLEGLTIEGPYCSPDLPFTRALHLTSLKISLTITQVERLCTHADVFASLRSLQLTLGIDEPPSNPGKKIKKKSNPGSCSEAQMTESNRLACLAKLPALEHISVLMSHCTIDPLGPLRTAQRRDAAAFQLLQSYTCIGELSNRRPSVCAQLPESGLCVSAVTSPLLPFPHLTSLHISCCHSALMSAESRVSELSIAFPHVRRLFVHGLDLQGMRSAVVHQSWRLLHTLLIDDSRPNDKRPLARAKTVPRPVQAKDLPVLHSLSSLPSLLCVILPELCRLDRRDLQSLLSLRRVISAVEPLPNFSA